MIHGLLKKRPDVVKDLRARGVDVEFLVFKDGGHDVIKFKNKVLGYTKIIDFFKKHLNPQACLSRSS